MMLCHLKGAVVASLPPVSNLLAFEAVARRKSFALAAAELHLTASAISHQVARLESYLGVRLFERSAHGVTLSAAGESYLVRVGGALAAISTATDDLRQGVSNSLYLHSTPSFASLWLMPRLADFAQQYPDISLYLSAAHTPSDFALGQSDIDIRYGIPRWPGLEVQPLFTERLLPLASAAFIKRHRLKTAAQLLEVPLIQSAVSVVQWSDWFSKFTELRAPDRFALRFDRAQMALDAATQGLGVALESTTIAGRHLAERRLLPVLGTQQGIDVQAHYVVYPARHLSRPPIAAFLRWLGSQTNSVVAS
jgi:DNA-binding transcriptional LysR family regulator